MIPFEEINERLDLLGKDRKWLAEASGRKPDSIRVALARNADPRNRTALLQRALSDAIEREEAARAATPALPPGYSEIFLDDAEFNLADRASRLVNSPSLAAFCHDVIQTEARRIIAESGPVGLPSPAQEAATEKHA